MSNFHSVETHELSDIKSVCQPESPEHFDMDSSALDVFTDFTQQRAFVLEQSVPVVDARELMKRAHVRLKIVIDSDESFRGVITAADLESVRVTRAQHATGLPLNEITLSDVMVPANKLRGITYDDLHASKIGDLVLTMRRFGDQHLLVVDPDGAAIRGIVSSSDIARRLHVPIVIDERATTFADIYSVIHG